jgi:endogenous inhibitor of DNA gyrase (YacG/DUF329 family)
MHSDEHPHIVKCPTCGADVEWHDKQRWRPFCSERCKMLDLGSWLDESNRIPGEETPPSPGMEEER